jgi:hypothetical protein
MIAEEFQTFIAAVSITIFHTAVVVFGSYLILTNSLFIKHYRQNILNYSQKMV